MADASAVAVVPLVLGGYATLQFVLFVRRVSRFAESHTTDETVAFADAIRPSTVAAVSKICSAKTRSRQPPQA